MTLAADTSSYAKNIRNTVTSIFEGMAVTLSWCLRKPVTIQYPDRTPKPVREMLPETYRGFLEVDLALCTACNACERACPIGCINCDVEKDPATKDRTIIRFDIDIGKCMYCGLCVESCPTGALIHTREFEGSSAHIENLVLRFVEKPVPPYKPAKGVEGPKRAEQGSIVRKLVRKWNEPSQLLRRK